MIAGKSYCLGRSIREWTRRQTTDDRDGHTARYFPFAEARGRCASLRAVPETGTGYAKSLDGRISLFLIVAVKHIIKIERRAHRSGASKLPAVSATHRADTKVRRRLLDCLKKMPWLQLIPSWIMRGREAVSHNQVFGLPKNGVP